MPRSKTVASDCPSSSQSILSTRTSAVLTKAKQKAAKVVIKTVKKVFNIARPQRKRRRTSKADAAFEDGDREMGFLADKTAASGMFGINVHRAISF